MFLIQYYNSWWLEWNFLPLAYFKTREEADNQLEIIKNKLPGEHLEFEIVEVKVSEVTDVVNYCKGGDNNYYILLNTDCFE